MIQTSEKEVWTDDPQTKRLHRIDSVCYFVRGQLLQGETAESFEEVNISDIPTGPVMPGGAVVRQQTGL